MSSSSYLYPNLGEYRLSSDEEESAEDLRELSVDRNPHKSARPGGSPSRHHDRGRKWRGYSTQNSASMSLDEFDKDYVDDDQVRRGYGEPVLSARVRGGGTDWVKAGVQWLVMTSKWKVALVGCLLGLLFAVLYQSCGWLLFDNSSG